MAPGASPHSDTKGTTFYVSLAGNDNWSGTRAEPNDARTDGPFASLARAREAIRDLKRTTGLPQSGMRVYLRGGVYSFSETFKLNAEDSGTGDAPVEWRAYPGETVSFVGRKALTGFGYITDPAILKRIQKPYHDKILVANLKAHGIDHYGEITQRGSPGMELFFRSKRMTVARWPNSGWLLITDVPQTGDRLFNEGLEREKRFDGVPVGRHYGRISYDGDRPSRWSDENEIYVHGYWTWDWSDSYQKVKSIDTVQREITIQEPHHHYGYTKNQRYYFLNILEELDSPGEWYLDRKNGLLYFWPPEPVENESAIVSILEEPLMALENADHVTINGIHFEYSRSYGVVITGGRHNLIAGCSFQFLGSDAVVVDGGVEHTVRSCDIADVALGALRLNGGDRTTLTPGFHAAINNHVHHYSAWIRTGQYAVFVDGVGNRVQHNLIHDAPHEALYLRGNDHLIEFNDISRVCQETGDAGALHTGRDWTWRGNVIRYNYFHHLTGPGLHGVMAVYLDDWASGFTVYGNVFYRSGRSAFIGGGRDNTVENNIFVECMPSVHVDARGLGWASYYFDGTRTELFDHLKEMKYHEPPYSARYPQLLTLDDGEPAVPKNNKIVRNVSYGGRWMDVYDYNAFDFSVVTVKDNLIGDPDVCRRREKGRTGWDPYYLDIDKKDGYVLYRMGDKEIVEEFKQNTFIEADPGFVNRERQDFRLRDDSPAFKLGFKRIPLENIGLFKDEYRLTLPD